MRGALAQARRELEADVLMRLRRPVELALTMALRRFARLRPEVFDRLGDSRARLFEIAPDELPVRFQLRPLGEQGEVAVVRDAGRCDVRISGPLATLLSLFDGSVDADAAYFSRAIRVEGETEAVVALHNALEAAEIDLADLAGWAAPLLRPPLAFAAAVRRRTRFAAA